MLSKTDANKLKSIRKIIGCELPDCGSHIELRIDEQSDKLAEGKKVYSGLCNKCGKRFKLRHTQLLVFSRVLGKPKVTVIPTTFNNLFEENE